MNNFWDERFATDEYIYGTEPNEFLKAALQQLSPGKILFPGEGEGRNAVFAAQQGWQVTAFDSSSVGREKAMRLAQSKGVSIDYQLASYDEADLPENSFDAVALIYTHVPAAKRADYHQKYLRYLKPGGHLILEGFSKAQIHNDTGGPKDLSMLWSENELRSDFEALSELTIFELEANLNEGRFHEGKAAIIRVTGRK